MTHKTRQSVSRIDLAFRLLAALFGGYGVSYAVAGALAVLLPVPRSEAAVLSAMLALVVYAAAILWVFSARSAARAWLLLLLLAVPCAAIAFLPGLLA